MILLSFITHVIAAVNSETSAEWSEPQVFSWNEVE